MNQLLEDVVRQAFEVFVSGALPVMLVAALAGTLAAILQTATAISEQAIGYAARVMAIAALLYALLPSLADSVLTLTKLAYR